jgi:ribose 5-phosphate isomerase B
MKIYLATDHAGWSHKEALKRWLLAQSTYEVIDCGARTFNAEDDYPDFITPAAQAVAEDPQSSRAIIFGGSGQGEAMCANRFKHVRATVYYGGPEEILTLSRAHNDANVLSIGARFVEAAALPKLVEIWLAAPGPHEEKYQRRITKMS